MLCASKGHFKRGDPLKYPMIRFKAFSFISLFWSLWILVNLFNFDRHCKCCSITFNWHEEVYKCVVKTLIVWAINKNLSSVFFCLFVLICNFLLISAEWNLYRCFIFRQILYFPSTVNNLSNSDQIKCLSEKSEWHNLCLIIYFHFFFSLNILKH